MIATLAMTDCRGRPVCPNAWQARRLLWVDVEHADLTATAILVARSGGFGVLAAYIEALAAVARVVCSQGAAVDVERLAKRLRNGVQWS